MKKTALLAATTLSVIMLAACGSTDDASSEITPDTVEMPADQAMKNVPDEPVADPEAGSDISSDAAVNAANAADVAAGEAETAAAEAVNAAEDANRAAKEAETAERNAQSSTASSTAN
ncbi:MAG: hypothetical protein ACK5NN_06365 [Sphingomonadaceae bacterium]